jgi:DNA-binding NarL/FixJ family response regulator
VDPYGIQLRQPSPKDLIGYRVAIAAIPAALALQPDVVLMDLTTPGMSGVEATERVLTRCPHITVLVLTMVEDDEALFAAPHAGARGDLLKGARKAEILRALQGVVDGEAIIGAPLAAELTALLAAKPRPAHTFPQLSSREREILLLTHQLTQGEIAA